ncbi:MAG: hypothetical protein D6806_01375 [Deltaproteobacteria bacterium]|nr:MAG: hypothetical protein D6806_01375 [Deltaproteobacteria bacterium]
MHRTPRKARGFLFALAAAACLPAAASAGAFEPHSGWQSEPLLETARGVSLGKSVFEFTLRSRFLFSDAYFDSEQDIGPAPADFFVSTLDLRAAIGFTENWTFWLELPVVWSEQTAGGSRRTDGQVGDGRAGLVYQFYRHDDPLVSLGFMLNLKLASGSESAGGRKGNITGTGTTDVELGVLGRWQALRMLSVGGGLSYNVRLPEAVQYLSDRISSITNAHLDLGDEFRLWLELTAAVERIAFRLTGQFLYRLPTRVGMAEYRSEHVEWDAPGAGGSDSDEYIIFNGVHYTEWKVHRRLDPTAPLVSNSGYLLSLSPSVLVKPLDWLEIELFATIHLAGKNSIFLTDKDGDNPSFENFMPMQTLGTSLGDRAVLGEFGLAVTSRF